MKKKNVVLTLLFAAAASLPASAQYSDIVNGIANAITPALSGSGAYKGFVETSYTQGFGNYRTSFASLTTSQGYRFTNWFYMGAGIGVELLWSTVNDGWASDWQQHYPDWYSHSHTSTAVMIPVFTDFRFMFGNYSATSFFINLRLGADFLCTNSYVRIRDGYLTNTDYFLFQPAFGVRIPISAYNPKQAIDIGIHYRLMTCDYWSSWNSDICLNGLGVNVAFEW